MPLDQELPELSAGGIRRSLLILPAVVQKGSAVFDHLKNDLVHGPSSQRRVVVEITDSRPAATTARNGVIASVFDGVDALPSRWEDRTFKPSFFFKWPLTKP